MLIQISKSDYKLLFNIHKVAKKYFKNYAITPNKVIQKENIDSQSMFYTKIYGDFSPLFYSLNLSWNEYITINTDALSEIFKTNKVTKFTNVNIDEQGRIGLQTQDGNILIYGQIISTNDKPIFHHISYDIIDKSIENDKFIELNENQVDVLLSNLRLRLSLFEKYDLYLVKNFFPLLGRKLKDNQSISISILDTGDEFTFYSLTRFIEDNMNVYSCFMCMKVNHK